MLLASVCASIVVLITRSALWHAVVLLLYDGCLRERYRRAAGKLPPNAQQQRYDLKELTRKLNSPFGRVLARRLDRQRDATEKKNANKTRKSVNTSARVGLVAAVPLCLLNALPLLSAILHVHWRVTLIEALVALSANVLTWPAGRQSERYGPVVTLVVMLATAIISGTIAGSVLCSLTRAAPPTAAAAVTYKYV